MRITVSKTLIAAMEAAANARAEKDEAFEELPDSETIRNDPGRYLNARVAHQKAKSTYDEKVRDLGVIVLQTSKPAFDNAEAIHAIRHEMLEVFNETSKGAINKRKLFVYGFIRAMYTAKLMRMSEEVACLRETERLADEACLLLDSESLNSPKLSHSDAPLLARM